MVIYIVSCLVFDLFPVFTERSMYGLIVFEVLESISSDPELAFSGDRKVGLLLFIFVKVGVSMDFPKQRVGLRHVLYVLCSRYN